MTVAELVARMTEAAGSGDPQAAVRAELEALKGDLAGLAETLAYLPGTGGNANQAFFRAPNLSLLKVSFPNGRRTPPHNHGTWANILLLSGSEKNTIYRRTADEQDFGHGEPPGVILLPLRNELRAQVQVLHRRLAPPLPTRSLT